MGYRVYTRKYEDYGNEVVSDTYIYYNTYGEARAAQDASIARYKRKAAEQEGDPKTYSISYKIEEE